MPVTSAIVMNSFLLGFFAITKTLFEEDKKPKSIPFTSGI
jgi:hypothetical protein